MCVLLSIKNVAGFYIYLQGNKKGYISHIYLLVLWKKGYKSVNLSFMLSEISLVTC